MKVHAFRVAGRAGLPHEKSEEQTIAGYRVKVEHRVSDDAAARPRIIAQVMADSLRRLEE